LPFEDDDTLSHILSKAFMRADDRNMKDQSILRQLAGLPSQRDAPFESNVVSGSGLES